MDDLSFVVRDNYLVITDNSDIPALLQDALRYIFLVNDETVRPFGGSGVYDIVTNITSGSVDYASMQLNTLATELYSKLNGTYPELAGVEFSTKAEGETITVELSLHTNKDTIKQIIYEV